MHVPDVRNQSPSEAVIDRVAAREGVEPTELDPLFETVDPQALDVLVGSHSPSSNSVFRIEFTYHGYDVTITADGVVHLGTAVAATSD